MPKRTNHFQQLVYLIQRQLIGEAIVKNSVLVNPISTDGIKREVDIVINKKIGNISFTVGIECIDRKRIADVTWVEQIKAKHDKLKIDKTILISKSGYTKQAKIDARNYGIDLLKWSKAQTKNWSNYINYFKNSKLVEYSFRVGEVALNIDIKFKNYSILIDYESMVYVGKEKEEKPMVEYFTDAVRSSGITRTFFENYNQSIKGKNVQYIIAKFEPSVNLFVKSDEGKFCSVLSGEIKLYIKEKEAKFSNFNYDSMDFSNVIHSDAHNIFSKNKGASESLSICISDEGGILKPSIYVPDFHGKGEKTFDLIVTKEGKDKLLKYK